MVVAVPARNEAVRIEDCLSALARQTERPDVVIVLINNSVDATLQNAESVREHLPFALRLEQIALPPQRSGAGYARRLAMALAADIAGPDGLLLTTDADAVVANDWIERTVANFQRGNDAVCGRALLDPRDAHLIPAHLHEDDRRECQLIDLLDQMAWLLDPERHDPYPRHTEASGASLAVTVQALREAGGIPAGTSRRRSCLRPRIVDDGSTHPARSIDRGDGVRTARWASHRRHGRHHATADCPAG